MNIETIIGDIASVSLDGVFNPWSESCAHDILSDEFLNRRQRLLKHFSCPNTRIMIIGEAPGYKGCRYSGIAFTSEKLLLNRSIPRMESLSGNRITDRKLPWSEPSATIVWKALYDLGVADETVMFNAVPWHPVGKKGIHSNRTPSSGEVALGLKHLSRLVEYFTGVEIVALGNTASTCLNELKIPHTKVRHPANGGATHFRKGISEIVSGDPMASVTASSDPI